MGWDGDLADDAIPAPRILRQDHISYATTSLPKEHFDGYYYGFCNEILWPLLHYLLPFFQFHHSHYDAYLKINEIFADRVTELAHPDDLIWVHDYHLMPLAAMLRERGVKNPIGFFLHIPFPALDALRTVPVYRELLNYLCGYDLVGFQTENDRRSFMQCASHGLGARVSGQGDIDHDGHHLRAITLPIGIDPAEFADMARVAAAGMDYRRMRDSLDRRAMIIGVERLDYSKGIVDRLRAYEYFLETYPESQNHVTYLQITPKSRTKVRAYDQIRRMVEETISGLNGRFASFDWVPVRYVNTGYPRRTLAGFFQLADLGLVTPLRDGMNLVAKEYVAAQDPNDPGVLVLSTLAGAAKHLTDALLINPHDRVQVADSIHRGLHMPLAERQERHRACLDAVKRYDIAAWRSGFVEALTQAKSAGRADK